MKRQTVPTSPKSPERMKRDAQKETKQSQPHLLFTAIMFTIILGAVSGFFGFLIASNIPPSVPLFGNLNVVSLLEEQRDTVLLSTRRAEKSIVKQAPQTIEHIVSVYDGTPTLEDPKNFLGNAVVLTADGWMVMATSVYQDNATVVLSDGESYTIVDSVVDELSGMTFFQIEASNLAFVNFDTDEMIPVGQTFSVIEKRIGSYVVYERRAAGYAQTSESVRQTASFIPHVQIDGAASIHPVSSPVFYNNGTFAGLVTEEGLVVHSSVARSALESIVAYGNIERSQVEVAYVNVERLTKKERTAEGLPDHGIFVQSVKQKSPANDMLQAGDVVLSVNNEIMDAQDDFAAIIHSEPAGTVWFMNVLRDGEERSVQFES